jgi:hypothetical protein
MEAGLLRLSEAENRLGGGQSSAGQLARSRLVGHRPPLTVLLFSAKWRFFARGHRNAVTVQLRYLQTLLEIGSQQNSAIVFPLPIDLIGPLLGAVSPNGAPPTREDSPALPTSANRPRPTARPRSHPEHAAP